MDTIQNTSRPRPMSEVCRRREQLQAEGVRPDRLAWAVAQVSESAVELLSQSGPDMVRACLERARDPRLDGLESEALLVLAAAGMTQLRGELRALGVPVALTRNEAFRQIRRMGRKARDHQTILGAIRVVGGARVVAMIEDRQVPFARAIADAMVIESTDGDAAKVAALALIGAFGAAELHKGLRADPASEVEAVGAPQALEVLGLGSPRRNLRERSGAVTGGAADALAAMSFVQTGCLRRACRSLLADRRAEVVRDIKRLRRSGALGHQSVLDSLREVGGLEIIDLLRTKGGFQPQLVDRIVTAVERDESKRAEALKVICAFGDWRLRRGLKADAVDDIQYLGAEEIAAIVAAGSPHKALRERARSAGGARGNRLAVLSLIDQRKLEQCTGKALNRRVATAFAAAARSRQPSTPDRVGSSPVALAAGMETSHE
jgi:hypothetical protein